MAVLYELKTKDQWVVVGGDKLPHSPTGNLASVNDPSTWTSYREAKDLVEKGEYEYVGYVLTADDGIICIDIDKGVDEWGLLSEKTCRLINRFNSYTELSRSGNGVHIFIKADMSKDALVGSEEIYKAKHFIILTENSLLDQEIKDRQSELDFLLDREFNGGTSKEKIYKPLGKKIENGYLYMDEEYPQVSEGGRHLALLSYGGTLLNRGYRGLDLYSELLKLNESKCKPPLPRREVEGICKSIFKYEEER